MWMAARVKSQDEIKGVSIGRGLKPPPGFKRESGKNLESHMCKEI